MPPVSSTPLVCFLSAFHGLRPAATLLRTGPSPRWRSLAAILLGFWLWFPMSVWGAFSDFYGYPPTPLFPDMAGKAFFSWPSRDTDSYEEADALGLRDLNEETAGGNGWITHADGRFLRGDGKPVRFWALNVTGAGGYGRALEQGRFLAKRGVNLVRVHGGASKSLFAPNSTSLFDVNDAVIDQMHDVVSGMKRSGIYTFVSNTYFVLQLSLKASHGVTGYSAQWLAANPGKRTPYGLLFLDDRLRAAYRTWLTELMTRPNPNEPDRRPLTEDPAVAIVELLNEDNLFFNTFDPEDWPPEQQALQERRFYQWVGERYLDPEDSDDTIEKAVKRAVETHWFGRSLTRDDLEAGRLHLNSALAMSLNRGSALFRNRDQVAYLAEKQRGFFSEMTQLLRDLGYEGTVSATNWKTVNDARLLDLELYTYTATDVIDRHDYYSPKARSQAQFWAVSSGDTFFPVSAFVNPRESPLKQKQVIGHPHSVSEQAWVQYTPVQGEAPLAVAAYMSLLDVDTWVWFALDTRTWNTGAHRSWIVENPATLGQFPAAALLYRRGDVAEAGVVAREGRTPASLTSLEDSKIQFGVGFDVFRDDPENFDADPVPGRGAVDPAIGLVGRTVLDPSRDTDLVLPEALDHIEPETGLIRSFTGQLQMDTENGVMVIDSSRSQGANGFLGSHGPVETEDAVIDMRNAFGAVVLTSIGGEPLASADRILVQAFASNQRVGFEAEPVEMSYRSEAVSGLRILNPGTSRYEVERLDATVRLKGFAARWKSAERLDPNLYPNGPVEARLDGPDVLLELPATSLYAVLHLDPPDQPVARIQTRMFPNARLDKPYTAELETAGEAAVGWYLAPDSPALPGGLSLEPDGTLGGTPRQTGLFHVKVQACEAAGRENVLDERRIPLLVEPAHETTPWGTPSNAAKATAFGWVLDLDWPMVWSWEFNDWLYLLEGGTPGAFHGFLYGEPHRGWIWLNEALWPWYYVYSTADWKRHGDQPASL